VLILQCGAVPKRLGILEDFASMFIRTAKLGPRQTVVVDVTKYAPPKKFKDFASIMVTGSLSMVTEHPLWSIRLARWLKSAAEEQVPILGICYGHQLLADALGGEVGYHPKGLEIGTFNVYLGKGANKHPLLKDLPPEFPAHLAHSQTVLVPPKQAKVLAHSAHDPHQILSYGEKVITFQFHPEFNTAVMAGFLRTVGPSKVPGPGLGLPVLETPLASGLIRRFVELAS
jgi:GMP synthase (glutamine-hydrolysing)